MQLACLLTIGCYRYSVGDNKWRAFDSSLPRSLYRKRLARMRIIRGFSQTTESYSFCWFLFVCARASSWERLISEKSLEHILLSLSLPSLIVFLQLQKPLSSLMEVGRGKTTSVWPKQRISRLSCDEIVYTMSAGDAIFFVERQRPRSLLLNLCQSILCYTNENRFSASY